MSDLKNNKDNIIDSLSASELDFTMQFAQGLYNNIKYGYNTPFLQNINLQDLTNIRGEEPTTTKVLNALKHALDNSETLQGYSEFLEIFDTIYGKIIDYYAGILSYDLSITCKNVKDPQEYSSDEYRQDLKRVHKFLDCFDYRQEFMKVTKQVLRTGVSFNWFRDSVGTYNKDTEALEIEKQRNFALQFLPQTECLITGYFNKSSLLFDFNLDYFEGGTTDISLFDPWFSLKYAQIWKSNDTYIPSAPLNKRNGRFANYVQTSPLNGAWCFKWDAENFAILPPFASLMKSAINNDVVTDLQLDKDMISAYLLLAGEIGMMDGLKSGDQKNQTKFSAKTLGDFMSLVTSGLKRNVKTVAMPLENIRGWQYNDQNPNMANNQYNTTASQGASASRLIYSSDKMSQAELQNAILTDYNLVGRLYRQYENFLEFFVNKKTKKYKFSFTFSGTNYIFERESRCTLINQLASVGFCLNTSAWASAYGFKPQEFDRMIEEAHYGTLQNNLTLLLNRNTMTTDSVSTGGRPVANDNEIGDSGETSREYQ